jgi:Fic family protein
MNPRQEKAILRMFRAGVDGFEGGLSAENYIAITRTSRATATRDLQNLVEKGALTRTGELRHTRYHLNLPATAERG